MLIRGCRIPAVSNPDIYCPRFMAGGTMLGFLSHLVLDELFAIDLWRHGSA